MLQYCNWYCIRLDLYLLQTVITMIAKEDKIYVHRFGSIRLPWGRPGVYLCRPSGVVGYHVCVFFPSILDINGRTSRGHTGGRSHRIFNPPSFCGACLDFCREKDSAIPFPRRP